MCPIAFPIYIHQQWIHCNWSFYCNSFPQGRCVMQMFSLPDWWMHRNRVLFVKGRDLTMWRSCVGQCMHIVPFFVWHNFPAPANRAGIHQTFIDSVANSVHLNNWKLDAICKQSVTVHGLHGDSTFGNRWWTDQAERDPVLLLCSVDFGMLGSHFIRRGKCLC